MKRVVIVGGGFAGSRIAKRLEREFDVTLIDDKGFFEFTPGILRTLVDPTHLRAIQVRHAQYLRRTRIVTGCATRIDGRMVVVGRRTVPYDYLVIATGFRYSLPFKQANIVSSSRADLLRRHHGALLRARRVLIIGGGLVGVELAGEILDRHPEKEVVICHAAARPIQRNNERAIRYVERRLAGRTEFIAGERIVPGGRTFRTDKGRVIKADIAFLCTGIQANAEHLRPFLDSSLNGRNQLVVDPFLQVRPGIFAAGDITAINEEKTAQNAEAHADLVIGNIRRLEAGRPLVAYRPNDRPLLISLGRWDGLFVWGSFSFGGLLPALLKGFVEWRVMRAYR